MILQFCRRRPDLVVILAGVSAAMHVGKISPALPVLRDALGVTLVQAGFLLSLVQLAGMLFGLLVGLLADGVGLRRSLLAGLLLLSVCSAAGGWARDVTSLLVLRGLEGLGFLLASMPAPGLLRRLVPPARLNRVLGLWGAYMPLGTASALLLGTVVLAAWDWHIWWWMLAFFSAAMALLAWYCVPPDRLPAAAVRAQGAPAGVQGATMPAAAWWLRLRLTLAAPGPWLVAWCFAVYASQWLAVIGFLPSMAGSNALRGLAAAVPLALVALVNMVGNIASGRLLQRGVAASVLLYAGFSAMGLGALVAFAAFPDGMALPLWLRYGGILVFSMVGGLVPGTLFSLAVAVSPDRDSVSTTVGWMQQWSSIGQFAGPPVVAWVAAQAGGWHWTWLVTGSCSVAGLWLARLLARHNGRHGD